MPAAGGLGVLDCSRLRGQIGAGLLPLLSNLGDFPPSLLAPFCGRDRVKQTFLIFRACDINISLLY